MKLRCAICLFLLGALAAIGAAPVAAQTPLPPGGFRLPASNAYSIHALSFDGDPFGKRDAFVLFVGRKGASATYFPRRHVEVTDTTIAADLGRLGSIDLHFVPSNQTTKAHPRCEPQQSIEFDSGSYQGRIDFEGEEGFTEVHASRAAGEPQMGLNLICPGGPAVEGSGGHAPGAYLHVHRRWSVGSVDLQARTNSPSRPPRFEASIQERGSDVPVIRTVAISGAPAAFEYDVSTQIARLAPPRPFAGVARFERSEKRPGRLRGGFSVDFPGRSDVSLSGARGGLSRYVANPGQVFRSSLRRRIDLP
ncbi:MAG TPA: hypothetical protein VFJ61_07160 [Solirubrobacterales bacterium]|nr:hypothetical protein [Solirubrobacterales bacterium]